MAIYTEEEKKDVPNAFARLHVTPLAIFGPCIPKRRLYCAEALLEEVGEDGHY